MLHIRGVHYDVGHQYEAGQGQDPESPRPHFEKASVQTDLAMIARQLHANAVRVTGTDLSRVAIAAGLALEAGLTVWFRRTPAGSVAIYGEPLPSVIPARRLGAVTVHRRGPAG